MQYSKSDRLKQWAFGVTKTVNIYNLSYKNCLSFYPVLDSQPLHVSTQAYRHALNKFSG